MGNHKENNWEKTPNNYNLFKYTRRRKNHRWKETANQIATEFSQNSSSNHYSSKFQKYKNIAEKEKLNFTLNNDGNYNSSFTITELKNSINKAKNTATGPDEIRYQFLKHLPEASLTILLQIFNDLWWSNNFPKCWLEAIIIPISKPGKDLQSHKVPSYRPN